MVTNIREAGIRAAKIVENMLGFIRQTQGTGLGLSVSCFIITEDHGGTLTVDSEPGKGTCFTICLPWTGTS